MDGNGRWAQNKHLPRAAGHKSGVKTLRRIVEHCVLKKIKTLTVYAFSSENWQRPQEEVTLLMELFMSALKDQVAELNRNNVKICFIGDREDFPKKLQAAIDKSEITTADNDGLNLNVAANYGGRWDIVNACKAIVEAVDKGQLSIEQIDEGSLSERISLAECPAPDLFIRTGGEKRISNYLLWQLAYTELYFTDVLWPNFGPEQLDESLKWYAERQRRFGRTSEQVTKASA